MKKYFEPSRRNPADKLGFVDHPDVPLAEEHIDIRPIILMMGFEAFFVDLDIDYERLTDDQGDYIGLTNISVPESEHGAHLVCTFEGEDGPAALYVREISLSLVESLTIKYLVGPSKNQSSPSYPTRFFQLMRNRMIEEKNNGRAGWWHPNVSNEWLSSKLSEAAGKKDWVGVATFSAMLEFRETYHPYLELPVVIS